MIHINDDTIRIKQGELEAVIFKKGATLNLLSVLGHKLLWEYESKNDVNLSPGKSAWLFPFPNRLKDGIFHHNGKEYQFPVNDPSGKNNAIHGFVFDKQFEISESLDEKEYVQITLYYDYKGEYEFYPFPFRFYISYLFHKKLKISIEVVNTGETELPFGIGWHPYFLPDDLSKSLLKMPESKKIMVDGASIPTGVKEPFKEFSVMTEIGNTVFDDCFLIGSGEKIVTFQRKNFQLELKMADDWRFFQIFIPSERNSIALEPMTCNVNALNNKEGLHFLQPNGSFSTFLELQVGQL